MADTLTTALQLIQQVSDSNAGTWDDNVETNWLRIEQAIAEETSKAVTGGTDTLTSAEQRAAALVFTGTLVSNETVIVAATEKIWWVYNNTSGAFTLTVKTSAGTGIAVTQGSWVPLRCDGTNVLDLSPTASFPVSDGNSLVYDSGDNTAQVRIDAGNVTTATVRVLTMADQDIDLDPSTGTFQAADAGLADIAALAVTDGNIIVGDGLNWVAESGATARTSLGLGTADTPQFTGIELGHATDTTLARPSAGDVTIEGNIIYRAGGTDVAVADGGTGASNAAGAKTNLGFITDLVDDTTPQLGGALDGQGNDLNNLGVIFMTEQAAAELDVAGKGQWWVKTTTPNVAMFTDDAGSDWSLANFEDLASTSNGLGASLIGIEDSGLLITATTVEGALAENRAAIDAIEADYLTSSDIGSSVQAQGAVLDDFNTLGAAASDGQFIVATGAGAFAYESGVTARTSLGLTIGTDVQAFHAYLADIAGITAAQGDIIYFNGTDWVNLGPGTSGQYLQTNGAAANPAWATAAGSGDVVKVGTPVNNQLGVWTGDGTLEGDAALTFDGSALAFHETTNDGNPSVYLGATTSEQLHIQAIYDTGAQTLDYVSIHTEVASATADKGLFRFNVDGTDILDIDDDGLEVTHSILINGNASAQGSLILGEDTDNGSNTMTLQPPAAITTSFSLTFPDGDGDANQALIGNGSGVFSWATPGLLATAAEWTARQNFNETSLTSTTNSVAWDVASNQVAAHTLTENTTFSAPSNMPAGTFFAVRITQHASAAKTVGWNAVFKAAGGSMPTMTATLSAVDLYVFWSDGTNAYLVGYQQDLS